MSIWLGQVFQAEGGGIHKLDQEFNCKNSEVKKIKLNIRQYEKLFYKPISPLSRDI